MEMRKSIRTILSYTWPFSKFIAKLDYLYDENTQLRKSIDQRIDEVNSKQENIQALELYVEQLVYQIDDKQTKLQEMLINQELLQTKFDEIGFRLKDVEQKNTCLIEKYRNTEVSYSSYGEDIILRRIFYNPDGYHSKHHIDKGFYVDVGAHHPNIASNTKFFYDCGWSGINIEANPAALKPFRDNRPRDINLNCAIMSFDGSTTFYLFGEEESEFYGSSSTTDKEFSDFVSNTQNVQALQVEVNANRLDTIFEKYNVEKIDFMSIDIEKGEYEALQSNNWEKYRPLVLAIEILPEKADYSWTYKNNSIFSYLSDKGYVVFSCTMFTWFFYDKYSERIQFINRWTKLEY